MPRSRWSKDSVDGSVTGFFNEFAAGDKAAMQPLWDHYFPRLIGLARQTLGSGPQRAAGPDDAVQGAFISFWKQAKSGLMSGPLHRDNLWAILSVMTVRQARKQLRREKAKKREGDRRRVPLDDLNVAPGQALDALSPQEFDLHSEELLLLLKESLRPFAILKLMGNSNAEAATTMECTERTVERKLQLIRQIWESETVGS